MILRAILDVSEVYVLDVIKVPNILGAIQV